MTKPRDYAKEYREYQGTPEQIARRSSRNKARRKAKNNGINIVGKDIDHKNFNPMDNSLSNIRAVSKSSNRARKPQR